MKVWVDKQDLEWLRENQLEGRTRSIIVYSFPNLTTDVEVEIR